MIVHAERLRVENAEPLARAIVEVQVGVQAAPSERLQVYGKSVILKGDFQRRVSRSWTGWSRPR
jgi:hypothetical protein